MSNYSNDLESIRKLRQEKYLISKGIKQKEKPVYNYELRKETLD
jgi:hypothetical protein